MKRFAEGEPRSFDYGLQRKEVNGNLLTFFDDGEPSAPRTILNIYGLGGESGEGNRRLAFPLTGIVENSQGMQDFRKNLHKAANKIEHRVQGLDGKYRIITVQAPRRGLTIVQLAKVFGNLMEDLDIDKYGVFGSSAGGEIGIVLAATRPENVTGLFMQGTMTRRTDMDQLAYWGIRVATLDPIEEAIIRTPLLQWGLKEAMIFASKNDPEFKLTDAQGRRQMERDTREADAKTLLKLAEGIGKDLRAYIARVKAPVMFMDGADGSLVKIDKMQEILARFAEETLGYKIKGKRKKHGHTVLNTFPELMAVLIDHAIQYFGIE